MHCLEHTLAAALRGLPGTALLRVAYSGGLDSTVLLHLCAALRDELAVAVAAVHVDHALHPDSASWAAHCGAVCASLRLPLTVLRVDAARARAAQGVEAAAREARYAALAQLLAPGDCLLTAHHREDQAETVLLQLLRGSGPAGLAAMPAVAPLGRGLLARPLLGVARAELRAYAQARSLVWLDDPSNHDPTLGRGWLRAEVLPRLRAYRPGADAALARTARHCADAAAIVDERAADDLASLATASPWQLQVGALARLAAPRQRAVLRHWCTRQGVALPDTARLDEILAQIAGAACARAPQVEWPGGAFRRYRDRLYLDPGRVAHAVPHDSSWSGRAALELPSGHGTLALTAGSALDARLRTALLEVRFRPPGLRAAIAGRAGHHTLKNLFQEAGVPPWLRGSVPVLFADGVPAAIGDRWVCVAFAASPGGAGLALAWHRPEWLAHWCNAAVAGEPPRGHGAVTL